MILVLVFHHCNRKVINANTHTEGGREGRKEGGREGGREREGGAAVPPPGGGGAAQEEREGKRERNLHKHSTLKVVVVTSYSLRS